MKRKRLLAAFLILAALLSLFGCKKAEPAPVVSEDGIEITDPNILTHVFREAARTKGSVKTAVSNITPYYDRETGILTFVAEEPDSADGEEIVHGYTVRTMAEDGTETVKASLALTGKWIMGGFLDRDGLICMVFSQDENLNRRGMIGRYGFAEGEWTMTDDVLSLFEERQMGVRGPVRDAEGNYCVAAQYGLEILVLSPEGKRIRSFTPEIPGRDTVGQLVASEDGRIFARFSSMSTGSTDTAEVFTDKGEIGALWKLGNSIFGGAEGIPFFYTGDEGLYAKSPDGGRDKLLLNYLNSNLSRAEGTPFYVSPSAVFIAEIAGIFNPFDGGQLVRYVPADNIDLREQKILNLAYFDSLPYTATVAVNRFNRSHPEARIVTSDWSQYNTTENPRGGYDRLCTDMVTGKEVPDILIGELVTSSPHLTTALEHGLYTDLTPFLESDPVVNADNLFGCVKRLFDDGKGGMWGIAPSFIVSRSLVSTPELLGIYAEKGYWTISEALDYIESIPEDCEFLANPNRSGLPLLDEGDGYMIFVDREKGACSFDSPEFVRYLEYAKSLRAENPSPYADLDQESLAKPRMDGKIRAAGIQFLGEVYQMRRLMMAFSTKDWTMIGYPAPVERAGAGTSVSTRFAMMITSACDDPALAWEFVRQCFTSDEGQGGLPALKSSFDALVESWYGAQFEDFYVVHDYVYMARDMEHAITEADMQYPGILSTFEPEDRDKYIAILDGIGTTAAERGVRDIRNMIYEEASAFFSGVGSAEDCAKKIQSRVSIWLAERGK